MFFRNTNLAGMLENRSDELLFDALPIGVYLCGPDGTIVRYNRTAAELWGRSPEIGYPESRYCGSCRLFSPDGTLIPHALSAMAVALATGCTFRDEAVQMERPDGTRIPVLLDINALTDEGGRSVGAVSVFREDSRTRVSRQQPPSRTILEVLPVAVYMTDAAGQITFFNEAAAKLWGVRPEIGKSRFCGSWKLYWPDGTDLPFHESPMAVSLKEGRAIEGMEALAERPDGIRVPFLSYPSPLLDPEGNLTGGINVLVEISGRKADEVAARRLAALVEDSDDAILSKTLDGIITTWNSGAERLFGYTEEEIVGKLVTVLIPDERIDEEPAILARIRRGQRVEPYETIRRRKDGSLVEVSLCISPITDERGRVIAASKIARDITERKRVDEQRHLLLREMNHRVKNLFTVSASLVSLSARSASTAQELAVMLQERLTALARAHALTVASSDGMAVASELPTTLHELIRAVTSPFDGSDVSVGRVLITGPDVPVSGPAVTSVALFLHEFTTNSAKYGALAHSQGRIRVDCSATENEFFMKWQEAGFPVPSNISSDEGFGSILARATISSLGGVFTREVDGEGLCISLSLGRGRLTGGD